MTLGTTITSSTAWGGIRLGAHGSAETYDGQRFGSVVSTASFPPASSPPFVAIPPTAPSTYTVPSGTSINSSSALTAALASSTSAVLIIEDGSYSAASVVTLGAKHEVYARNLGGATLHFGLVGGQFANTNGFKIQGVAFSVTSMSYCFSSGSGGIMVAWATSSRGWNILDCTFTGTDAITNAVSIQSNGCYEGLVIQRCRAYNFHANGFRIDSNDKTYVPTTPPVLQDIYTENCVFKTNPGGSNGVSEAGLWLGVKATLNRLWCHQVPGYGIAGAHGGTKAWQGLWIGTSIAAMTATDVYVTGDIAFGTYAFGSLNTDDVSYVVCRRFETAAPVNVGFHIEWNNPGSRSHDPNVQNVITEDSYFESGCVGWDADNGTVHSTVRNTTFVGQQAYAINHYLDGTGMLFDLTGNNYTAAAASAGTGHAPDYACWG